MSSAQSAGVKIMVGAKQDMHACPSDASTTWGTESNDGTTSVDSCSWEEDCDSDVDVQDAPTRHRLSTCISEVWEDDFSEDMMSERDHWLARWCRKKATPVAKRAEISAEPEAEAEEVIVEDRVETPVFEEPVGDGWYAGALEAWRQLPSEMQQALSWW